MRHPLESETVLETARSLYPGSSILALMQRHRPRICPFEELLNMAPSGARALDIGCGAGLFLGLMAQHCDIVEGLGLDASADAIREANAMKAQHPLGECLDFRAAAVDDPWPDGPFDVISLIDVMHHVAPAARQDLLENIAARLSSTGVFIYKDMARQPLWRAWGNRLHDIVIARDWIAYEPIEVMDASMARLGFHDPVRGGRNILWYGHEWRAYRRGGAPPRHD